MCVSMHNEVQKKRFMGAIINYLVELVSFLTAETKGQLQRKFITWKYSMERMGLEINMSKTKMITSKKTGKCTTENHKKYTTFADSETRLLLQAIE